MNKLADDRLFIGQGSRALTEELQHVTSAVKRVRDQSARHCGSNGMKLIFKQCHHTEVSAAAASGPEEIRLFVLARLQHLPLAE